MFHVRLIADHANSLEVDRSSRDVLLSRGWEVYSPETESEVTGNGGSAAVRRGRPARKNPAS